MKKMWFTRGFIVVLTIAALCVSIIGCTSSQPADEASSGDSAPASADADTTAEASADVEADGPHVGYLEAADQPAANYHDSSYREAEAWAAEQLANMDTREKVGQLFMVRPEAIGYDTINGSYEDLEACLEQYPVGGLAYYKPNIDNPDQLRASLADAHAVTAGDVPLLLAVDEEGGTVARVAGRENFDIEDVGDMRAIGETGDPQQAYDASAYIAGYLTDYGFNMNFAPVADVTGDPEDMMYDRAFSDDPELVAAMVDASVRGFDDNGILSCVKHFPGLGEAVGGNSHENIVTIDATREELDANALIPFQAAIDAGVPMIMTGHIALPAITGDPELPATLSPVVLNDILRNDMGYQGVIITDALEMGGAAHYDARGFLSVYAFQAGADILLLPLDFQTAFGEMMHAVNNGTIPMEDLDESVMRILIMKYPLYVQQQRAIEEGETGPMQVGLAA